MREALKKLSGESLIYGFGQVSGRAVQLLLVPVLTRALTRGAYGVSELVVAYSQTAILVLVLGMDGALARFFYHEPDREARIRMVSSSLFFRLVTSVVIALGLALLSPWLAQGLFGSVAYRKYLLIGVATLPLTLLWLFANDVLRVTFQPWKFILLNVCQTVTAGGVALWLVLGRHLGVVGVLYGKLAADGLCAVLGLVLLRHSIRPRFNGEALKKMLAYGLPMVPGAFAFGLITSIDRFALQRIRSLEEVAVYAVAMKFFALVTIAISAFQLAYGPFAFARAAAPDSPALFARVFSLYAGVAALGALVVTCFVPEALHLLVPSAYWGAALPAAFLIFAAVIQGAYTISSIGVALALRTAWLSWTATAAALIAIAGQFAFTPRFGAPGAAAATFLGYATSAILTYRLAQRVHPLPYHGHRIWLTMALAMGAGVAAQVLIAPGWPGAAIKIAVILVTMLGIASLSGIRRPRAAAA
ncbi:MAG TPA: oligosaccharide flippase family protein [Candidatus Udaeobacter sp.]|jgi:O-antigen/teichoic acid export membrane protein|nr:oligosaccharide flippase family protein [Candidatus Udaeobacter sp.]